MSDAGAGRRHGTRSDPKGEMPVDWERDRRTRTNFVVFLAGPTIWFVYFILVYLVVELGCTGEGEGLRAFDPPVPRAVTLAATVVAAMASLAATWWAFARWRRPEGPDEPSGDAGGGPRRPIGFAALLLSALAFVGILFVGLPALYLPSC